MTFQTVEADPSASMVGRPEEEELGVHARTRTLQPSPSDD
jgi:hypothetical protein